VDYQARGVSECLVNSLINRWVFLIAWNQLCTDLCVVSSLLLAATGKLRWQRNCPTPALAACHGRWQPRRPSSHPLVLAIWVAAFLQGVGSRQSDV